MDEYGTEPPSNKKNKGVKRNARDDDTFGGTSLWNDSVFNNQNIDDSQLVNSGEWGGVPLASSNPLTFSNEFWIQSQEGRSVDGDITPDFGSMKIENPMPFG